MVEKCFLVAKLPSAAQSRDSGLFGLISNGWYYLTSLCSSILEFLLIKSPVRGWPRVPTTVIGVSVTKCFLLLPDISSVGSNPFGSSSGTNFAYALTFFTTGIAMTQMRHAAQK